MERRERCERQGKKEEKGRKAGIGAIKNPLSRRKKGFPGLSAVPAAVMTVSVMAAVMGHAVSVFIVRFAVIRTVSVRVPAAAVRVMPAVGAAALIAAGGGPAVGRRVGKCGGSGKDCERNEQCGSEFFHRCRSFLCA